MQHRAWHIKRINHCYQHGARVWVIQGGGGGNREGSIIFLSSEHFHVNFEKLANKTIICRALICAKHNSRSWARSCPALKNFNSNIKSKENLTHVEVQTLGCCGGNEFCKSPPVTNPHCLGFARNHQLLNLDGIAHHWSWKRADSILEHCQGGETEFEGQSTSHQSCLSLGNPFCRELRGWT